MKVKDSSVNLWGLQIEMRKALNCASLIWDQYGQELVVTSARDGVHSAGSYHYYGYAVDLRTRYFDEETTELVYQALKARLASISPLFQAIHHKTHIHIEYDFDL